MWQLFEHISKPTSLYLGPFLRSPVTAGWAKEMLCHAAISVVDIPGSFPPSQEETCCRAYSQLNLNRGCLPKTSQGTAFTFHALGLSRAARDRLEHSWSEGKEFEDVTLSCYKASVGDRHGQPGWASSLKPGYSSCVLEEQNKRQTTLLYFFTTSYVFPLQIRVSAWMISQSGRLGQ